MSTPEANAKALDVAIRVAAQKRLIAAIADKRLVETAINQASERIAAAYARS